MKPEAKKTSKEKGRSISSIYLAVTILLVAPGLYVLSVGPAAYLSHKFNLNPETFETIYAPVIWLADNTPLEKPLYAYVELWR